MSILAAIKGHLRDFYDYIFGCPPSKEEVDRRIAKALANPNSVVGLHIPAPPKPPLPNNPYELDRRVRLMRKMFKVKFGYYPDVFVVGPEIASLLVDMMNRQLPAQADELGGLPGSRNPIQIQKNYWNSPGVQLLPGNATYMTMEIVYESTPGRCRVRSSLASKLPPELR